MPIVMQALGKALADAALAWYPEEGLAHLTITFRDEEHYLGIDLNEPGLTEEILVDAILEAVQ